VTILRSLLIAVLLALPGCTGLDFGDHPGKDVAKETGPLTVLPAHLKDGSRE
jgi:hypothetical protein